MDVNDGIWANSATYENRLSEQTSLYAQKVLLRIASNAIDDDGEAILIEIGASTGSTTLELTKILPSPTRIYAIDANEDNVHQHRGNLHKYGNIESIHGNGWQFAKVFKNKGIELSPHSLHIILAANSLGIAATHMPSEDAQKYIQLFLSQAKDFLKPKGIILLTVGFTSLIIRINKKGFYEVLENDWQEVFFKRSTLQYETLIFLPWIHALRNRSDCTPSIPLNPIQIEDNSTFRYTNSIGKDYLIEKSN